MFGLTKQKLLATKKLLKNKPIRRGPNGLLIFNRKIPFYQLGKGDLYYNFRLGQVRFIKSSKIG